MTTTTRVVRPIDGDPPQSRQRRTILIGVAAAAIFAIIATWLIAFSSVFGVRSVEVHGNHVLTAEQIRAAADIRHGTPLVRVDTAAITKRVERLAEVASAQVSTSFPSTVVITVEERVPVGYIRRGGHVTLIDHTGAAYRKVAVAPSRLPRFVLPSGSHRRATGAAVADVAAALPPAVLHQVRSIEALDPSSITLVLSHGRVVRWGGAARTADKARLLPVLLKHHVATVDLTDPDQPFTRR